MPVPPRTPRTAGRQVPWQSEATRRCMGAPARPATLTSTSPPTRGTPCARGLTRGPWRTCPRPRQAVSRLPRTSCPRQMPRSRAVRMGAAQRTGAIRVTKGTCSQGDPLWVQGLLAAARGALARGVGGGACPLRAAAHMGGNSRTPPPALPWPWLRTRHLLPRRGRHRRLPLSPATRLRHTRRAGQRLRLAARCRPRLAPHPPCPPFCAPAPCTAHASRRPRGRTHQGLPRT